MADTVVGAASSFANQCLAWVDSVLHLSAWGGASAANAFKTYGGSAQATSNPVVGDIVLYGSNSGSGAGHAGIYAGNGNVLSVLSDGMEHLTDLQTLNAYEGGTQPIFVSSSSLGLQVSGYAETAAAIANAAVSGKITDTNGGNPITEPTGGITNTPGAGATCTPPSVPFGLNPVDWLAKKSTGNPGPTIGYYACVIGLDIQRGLWVILGLIVVGFGLWVYSQDKDAPGGTQLQKIDQIPVKAAEVGAAIGG